MPGSGYCNETAFEGGALSPKWPRLRPLINNETAFEGGALSPKWPWLRPLINNKLGFPGVAEHSLSTANFFIPLGLST